MTERHPLMSSMVLGEQAQWRRYGGNARTGFRPGLARWLIVRRLWFKRCCGRRMWLIERVAIKNVAVEDISPRSRYFRSAKTIDVRALCEICAWEEPHGPTNYLAEFEEPA